jgi:putative tryptophan/tyrosine transport system substrate-binding protein
MKFDSSCAGLTRASMQPHHPMDCRVKPGNDEEWARCSRNTLSRRSFLALLGGTAALAPLVARAQQPAMPLVGMLNSGNESAYGSRMAAFRQGLGEAGYVEGRNVSIEHRWANDHYDRLPALATELVQRRVAVLFAAGGGVAPQAAKSATSTIPIVFTGGFDPVQAGLVASINRPGGNMTGIIFLTNALEAKRLGLLHELVPQVRAIGVLVNPRNASVETVRKNLGEAAGALGVELRFVQADNAGEFDQAFSDLEQVDVHALLVASDSVFSGNAEALVALSARHKMTAMYFGRDFAKAGGLMSYGTSVDDAYRQAAVYVGRILKGEKPADLPVVQSTKFEFVINLKTAKALGVEFPSGLLSIADEVIE